jgi:ParB-like chromosome segregation protein Spo0J
MEKFGRTQENIAQTVGKSRSHVANTLRLLALPDEVQSYLVSGETVGRSCPRDRRGGRPGRPGREIIDKGLSVRDDRGPGPQGAERPASAKNKGGRPPRSRTPTPRRWRPTCRRCWAWTSRSTIAARPGADHHAMRRSSSSTISATG